MNILMRYIGIFQLMEPRNLLKPDFETSVTFEPLGIFWCGFHFCSQENDLYHFILCNYPHWIKRKDCKHFDAQFTQIEETTTMLLKTELLEMSKSTCTKSQNTNISVVERWHKKLYRQFYEKSNLITSNKMSLAMRKCVLCHMRTTKVHISLRIRAVWSAPLLFAVR